MNIIIQDLIFKLNCKDSKVKSNTITDLALLLEIASAKLDTEHKICQYSTLLKNDLIMIDLTKDDEVIIVENLKALVLDQDEMTRSLIWAIGKSEPITGIKVLLEIIENSHRIDFNDRELYQFSISLINYLPYEEDISDQNIKKLINSSNLGLWLEQVLRKSSSEISENIYTSETKEYMQLILDLIQPY